MRPLLATSAPLRGPRAGPPARRLSRPGPPAGAYWGVSRFPWAFLAPASPPGLPLCSRGVFRRRAPPAWRGGGPSLGPLCFRAVIPRSYVPARLGFLTAGLSLCLCRSVPVAFSPAPPRPAAPAGGSGERKAGLGFSLFPGLFAVS